MASQTRGLTEEMDASISSAATKTDSACGSSTQHLRPLFEVGEQVVAAWWDNDEQTGESQWYPGKIMSYKAVDTNGVYGPMMLYNVHVE